MNWYAGSIPDAVNEVKCHQKILLVFVSGDDELSKKMAETYDDSSVSSQLNLDNCLALKLTVNSVSYQQFSAIYPVVVVPSSYFIGRNGLPIEIISGSLEPSQLLEKVNKIFQENQIGETPSESKDEVVEPMESSDMEVSVQNGSETTNEPSTSNATEDTQEPVKLEEKLERAKTLLEQVRRSKAIEEKEDGKSSLSSSPSSSSALKKCVSSETPVAETDRKKRKMDEAEDSSKEKNDEISRRKMGKQVQKAQMSRQDNELKEWAQNRAKEKEEERVARERVRAQIAQDRAERAARYQQVKAEESAAQKEREAARIKEEQEKATRDAAMRSTMARLQFRLPDGSSVVQQFPADSTLDEARQFVLDHVRTLYSNVTLCTTFPRRHFVEANYSETLRDLELAPSAAILVLPGQPGTVANVPEGGFFVNIFWILVSPFMAMWKAISSVFRRSSPPPSPPQPPPTSTDGAPSPEPGPSTGPVADEGQALRRRQAAEKFYREGNVYRMSNRQADDEDDNNTWNGNSTQQM